MERTRLSFHVTGSTLEQVRTRATQVVREFLQVEADKPLDQVSDVEIDIEGVPADGHTISPLPSYDFIGKVHVRIKS